MVYQQQEEVQEIKAFFKDKAEFLEFGAGTGIVARKCQANVLISDYLEESLDLIQRNAKLNYIEIDVKKSDWN
jgi:methylase of polypeptide subunit release factors